jgi:hypothetical protein
VKPKKTNAGSHVYRLPLTRRNWHPVCPLSKIGQKRDFFQIPQPKFGSFKYLSIQNEDI